MTLEIRKAVRVQRKFRCAIIGPSGSGKTNTALRLMRGLVGAKGTILLGDTERQSATLYSDLTEFDHANITDFRFENFLELIAEAAKLKYDGLIIDSVSHAWEGFLEMHEQESARARNSFTAWSKITPLYNSLIQAIVSYPGHIIVTMRAKTEYVIEKNEKGKDAPRKVGLAPVMRPGSEYEFDVVATMDLEHNFMIEKSRIDWLADKVVKKPKQEVGAKIAKWLAEGAEVLPPQAPATNGNGASPEVGEAKDPIVQKAMGNDDIPDFNQAHQTNGNKYLYDLTSALADESQKAKKLAYIEKWHGQKVGDGLYMFENEIKALVNYRVIETPKEVAVNE